MKLLVALILFATAASGATFTNIQFGWDLTVNAVGYRFWDVMGTNRMFLGETTQPFFTVSNWNISISRTVSVSAFNMTAEGAMAPPLIVPPAPLAVTGLKTVPLSIVATVPGVIEFSQDLVDWNQRLRLSPGTNSTNVNVTWMLYPREPMMFMRNRTVTLLAPPPLPTLLRPP